MSEPFKPGDLIRRRDNHNATATIGYLSEDSQRWRTESSAWLETMFWELVEPSVPVSKIREVCRLMVRTDAVYSDAYIMAKDAHNAAIESLYRQLTGEQL